MPYSMNLVEAILVLVAAMSIGFLLGYITALARSRRGRELPMVEQAWTLKGRGVVIVTAVDPKKDKVTYTLKNNKGTWSPEDSVTESLSRFMHYAKVAADQTLTRIKDDPEPDPLEPIEPEDPEPEAEPEPKP